MVLTLENKGLHILSSGRLVTCCPTLGLEIKQLLQASTQLVCSTKVPFLFICHVLCHACSSSSCFFPLGLGSGSAGEGHAATSTDDRSNQFHRLGSSTGRIHGTIMTRSKRTGCELIWRPSQTSIRGGSACRGWGVG